MDMPVEIVFQDFDRSPALEANIRERAAKLSLFEGRASHCRVVVSRPRARGQQGHLYKVHIDVAVPGTEPVVVDRDPGLDHGHEDVYVAVRDAFAAATRQLQDHAQRRADARTRGAD
ncbi:MAG: HPF/RaiA family ribosome-associated protein [Nannocystaceae bacterium]|nr:HPF/RaiA family ribosome-associated protein [Nannocystaceae bacterium]